jgi:Holliday junction DNA helicase RuvA
VIASLRGSVAALGLDHVVLETGGVGLRLACPPRVLADLAVGAPAHLHTSLVVREDSLTLYGFTSAEERDLFEVLLGVSGIGPRLAIAMLAVLTPDEIHAAVAADDLATLTRVPGIGRKGAQRLVLELKDRLASMTAAGPAAGANAAPASTVSAWGDQVTAALVGLGWSARDAAAALDAIAPQANAMLEKGDAVDVPALLRAALRSLDRS